MKDSKGLPDMVMGYEETRLVLGTVQLGLDYGIANENGKPTQDQATAIIHEAWKNGIREFDTAQGYGKSESVLGKALSELGLSQEARVITKIDPSPDHCDAVAMSVALEKSLEKLKMEKLFGLMLHREETLSIWERGLGDILHDFVSSGRVERIGISAYSPARAIQALSIEGIDMVQLPTNILDRRFEKAGIFKLAEKRKKKIYIRSAFLQGLLLM